jgi:hypothetical protein
MTSFVQKNNAVLKSVSEKQGEELWSGVIWLNIYEQRRSHANMAMSFVPHKGEEFLG